jgi:hypothetical protein
MPLSAIKNAYDETLLDNTATLVQIETALRNVTWFLPGRFQDAEVASEGGEPFSLSLPGVQDMLGESPTELTLPHAPQCTRHYPSFRSTMTQSSQNAWASFEDFPCPRSLDRRETKQEVLMLKLAPRATKKTGYFARK